MEDGKQIYGADRAETTSVHEIRSFELPCSLQHVSKICGFENFVLRRFCPVATASVLG